ncbi:glycine betaine/L-proline ABC transporter ATP-binding protein ProV [Ectothiorhodospiraceae bacterium WFHF3C12]|nr:glycine betaine/L-proline ABC transporter ATP-binding protein ProV [Ectothiorhodospiraceae bacterium WFHF3C12]
MAEDKIVLENLYKIFGPNPDDAFELLEKGHSKDEIFEKTGTTVGVRDATCTIKQGEIFVVMGLSGSGKSTLVRMLNRLIEPTRGRVLVDGDDVTAMDRKDLINLRRHDMAMVFQSFALMPHKTVLDNAGFGLEVAGIEKSKRDERSMKALEQVGLKANAESFPSELSGGMQQRVGLARALAMDPSILLMDEAFSALDPLIRTEMQDELLALQEQSQRTVVFISHDLDEAMRIGDRIAIMEGGAIVQVGTPEEIVTNPANDYVKSFFYGVDVSQVFNAGDIADRKQVTVVERPGVSVRAAFERLREHSREIAIVTDKSRKYLGMVSAETLTDQIKGGGEPKYSEAFLKEVEAVQSDMSLSDVLSRVAASRYPVPVVDSEGRYVGAITKTALLQTLDKAG